MQHWDKPWKVDKVKTVSVKEGKRWKKLGVPLTDTCKAFKHQELNVFVLQFEIDGTQHTLVESLMDVASSSEYLPQLLGDLPVNSQLRAGTY